MHRSLACVLFTLLAAGCGKSENADLTTGSSSQDSLIHISSSALASGNLSLEPAREVAVSDTLVLNGEIQADPLRIAHVAPRVGGSVQTVRVVIGDHVGRGQVVASLYSPEFTAAMGDYLLAHERAERTRSERPGDYSSSASIAQSARQRLMTLGATSQDVALVEKTHQALETLPLRSPINGVVTEVETGMGKQVTAGTDLFGFADLTQVWAVVDAYEPDFGRLRVGQTAQIHTTTYPGRVFRGSITSLEGSVKPETRTITSCGQRRRARAIGIAERTPNCRAS